MVVARARGTWLAGCLLLACGGGKTDEVGGSPAPAPPAAGELVAPANCPPTAPAPDPLPGIEPAMAGLDYWIGRDADAVVLDPADVGNLVAAHAGALPPSPPPRGARSSRTTGSRQARVPAPSGRDPGLTRRAWLEAALALVGKPAADDPVAALLAGFGLPAGGSFTIDMTPVKVAEERLLLIDAAAGSGIVLLEAGDHKMVWLGRDRGGTARVLHAVVDYPARCVAAGSDNPAETRMQIGRVVVSGLDLGAGSAAGSLLDRLSRVVVFGRVAGPKLEGVTADRPAAAVAVAAGSKCKDSEKAAIFFSPARPNGTQPMRVIATLSADPGPIGLTLVDPDGARHTPPMVRLGGPPWSYVVTVDAPAPGKWTAALGDGTRLAACDTVKVYKGVHPRKGSEAGSVWPGFRRRSEATENLYAAFVERLFDYPVEEDLTWPNLHTLLRDREHNILYGHLGHGEDDLLVLDPDCADLPYMLQAYFAWKMDIPYGFLTCSRGSGNKAPRCKGAPEEALAAQPKVLLPADFRSGDNLMQRIDFKKKDEVGSFAEFSRRVFRGVSSASGRTGPRDDLTDWYPVPLTREALRPGTLFADPYGHLLVIAGWYPQKPGGYGILMGADAQPDATIGRRRFWRGNYLFSADTKRAGAGFKAYRPRGRSAGMVVAWDNHKLKRAGWWTRYSEQQYAGTTDDFYDAMEALINPRPLDAMQMQVSLVDALQEAVVRRVNSVDNGEKYMATATAPVEMPEGAKIFLTSGPWEDYSTPARDHRILIAIDTVLGLPEAVRRRPERYRLDPSAVDDMVARLAKNLDVLLTARKFSYTRSDGSKQELTLKDVISRAAGFEMSYNPNDCAEIRWAAPEGSAEMQTCTRRAPDEQRERMEKYRVWFKNRERPVE